MSIRFLQGIGELRSLQNRHSNSGSGGFRETLPSYRFLKRTWGGFQLKAWAGGGGTTGDDVIINKPSPLSYIGDQIYKLTQIQIFERSLTPKENARLKGFREFRYNLKGALLVSHEVLGTITDKGRAKLEQLRGLLDFKEMGQDAYCKWTLTPKLLTFDEQAILIGLYHFQDNLEGAMLYRRDILGDELNTAEYLRLLELGQFPNNPRRTELLHRKALGIITPEQVARLDVFE